MALRAFYEFETKHSGIDRIEIHDTNFSGTAFELCGDSTAFDFKHDIITSESNDALLNVHANRIQVGKLDFRPRINSTEGKALLTDIRDSTGGQFTIQWLKDGALYWAGSVTTRVFQYPEKETGFFAQIRATDFDVLKGQDFALDDQRQTFIDTFSDLFGILPTSLDIVTRTSWVEENVTANVGSTTYDFLGEIYHETKALREFARTGDETPQPITYWDALGHVGEPALFIRQMGGKIYIEQLTDLADPTDINETTYNADGTVQTATASVNRVQAGYTSSTLGQPAVKITSQNESYPAVKRAKVLFDHRSVVEQLKLPSNIYFDGQDFANFEQDFIPNRQIIELSGNAYAQSTENERSGYVDIIVRVGQYYYDGTNWLQDNTARVRIDITGSGAQVNDPDGDYYIYRGPIDIRTPRIPSNATSPIEIQINNAIIDTDPVTVADETSFEVLSIVIEGTTSEDEDAKTTAFLYELTQTGNHPFVLDLDKTWFGDGPGRNSPSALRYGTGDGEITSNTWQRRGSTSYRKFHHNLLAEVIDMGRTNTRKLEADIWGNYDPTQVLDYNGDYWFYAGGRYQGTTGKWKVTLMKLAINEDAGDDFEDIPKFTDETGSGSGSTGGTGGGGGGIDQGTADARYLQESLNLSDLDSASTAISNLGITATATELNRLDGNLTTVYSNLGLTDGTADLDLNSLDLQGNLNMVNSSAIQDAGINAIEFDGSGNVSIPNDLTVLGTTTSVNSDNLDVDDPLIKLADGNTTDMLDIGILGQRSSDNVINFFDESEDEFAVGYTTDDSTTEGNVTLTGYADLHVNNLIAEDDLVVGGTNIFPSGNYQALGTGSDVEFNSLEVISNNPVLQISDNDGTERFAGIDLTTSGGEWWIKSGNIGATNAHLYIGRAQDASDNILTLYRGGGGKIRDAFEITGTLTGVDASFSSTVDITGLLTVGDDIVKDNFSLTTDFSGTGWEGDTDGDFNIRNLVVRENARFRHLIVDELGIIAGSDLRSIARGKIQSVDTGTNTVVLENPRDIAATSWIANDFFWAKAVDIDGSDFLDIKGQVTNVDTTSNVITLTLDTTVTGGTHDGGTTDISGLSPGDVLVQRGHPSNTDRQSLIYTTVSDSDAPVQKWLAGVDSVDAFDNPSNVNAFIGNLENAPDVTGFGLHSANAYLTESVLVGDLTKAGNYLEYASGSLTTVLDELDVTIDGSNSIVADGTGVAINATSFNLDASNVNIGETSGWFGASDVLAYNSDGSVDIAGFSADNNSIEQSLTGSRRVIMGDTTGSGFWGFGVTQSGGFIDSDKFVRMFMSDGAWGFQALDGSGQVFRIGETASGDPAYRIAGSYFDETDMWGGDSVKSNASVRLDFANGRLYYDAMGGVLYSKYSEGTPGSATDAADIGSAEYRQESASATTPLIIPSYKVRVKARKRFGIDEIIFAARGRSNNISGSSTEFAKIRIMDADGTNELASNRTQINSSTTVPFSITVDVSGITDGDQIQIWAGSEIDLDVNSRAEVYINEDIIIYDHT